MDYNLSQLPLRLPALSALLVNATASYATDESADISWQFILNLVGEITDDELQSLTKEYFRDDIFTSWAQDCKDYARGIRQLRKWWRGEEQPPSGVAQRTIDWWKTLKA